MHLNSKDALSSPQVLLVPYCKHHVPAYHQWMQDAELRVATASEELTLEEEYAMQKSWRQDHDKLTFIICKPLNAAMESPLTLRAGQADSSTDMVGDINLFLSREEYDTGAGTRPCIVGEIELMIASKQHRRQGYGRASLMVFLNYITMHETEIMQEHTGGSKQEVISYLRVKINQHNDASISLFKTAGFRLVSSSANYFGEIELRANFGARFIVEVATQSQYRWLAYDHDDEEDD